MTSYIFEIFLLTEASVPRIVSALLANGFTVEPWVEKDELTIHSPDSPSVILSVKITHAETDQDQIWKMVRSLIRKLEVPFYGAILTTGGRTRLSSGFLPKIKKPATLGAGPYRTTGSVIPFPGQDDGIIDDTKK